MEGWDGSGDGALRAPAGCVARRGIRVRTKRRIGCTGHAVGRWTRIGARPHRSGDPLPFDLGRAPDQERVYDFGNGDLITREELVHVEARSTAA